MDEKLVRRRFRVTRIGVSAYLAYRRIGVSACRRKDHGRSVQVATVPSRPDKSS